MQLPSYRNEDRSLHFYQGNCVTKMCPLKKRLQLFFSNLKKNYISPTTGPVEKSVKNTTHKSDE